MITLQATGSLSGKMNPLRRWIAKAMADHPAVFVVPGADVARVQGVDVPLPLAAHPREASILLVVAPLPEKLAEKAAVAFAQMPRPRAILSIGLDPTDPLPPPDVIVPDYASLADGLTQIKHLLATQAWSKEAAPYEQEALRPEQENESAHHHHDHTSHAEHGDHKHGKEASQEEEHQPHQEDKENQSHTENKESHQDEHHEESDHQHQAQGRHEDGRHEDGRHEDGHGGESHQEDDEHQGHEHHDHGGGMMSMEMMTKDLPRSVDGLPMDWNETHFGPFFPGLAGGLSFHAQLDGDTVAQLHWMKGLTARHLTDSFPGNVAGFPDRLAAISLFSPNAYRILAAQALEQIAGTPSASEQSAQRLYLLEKERILNHLNGLAQLGVVAGNLWIEQQARKLFFLIRQDAHNKDVQKTITTFLHRVRKLPFLRQKLQGIGVIPSPVLHHACGPVLRASRLAKDLRAEHPTYQQLSFQTSQQDSNDSWGRLLVRLSEIEESLRLIHATAVRDDEPTLTNISGDISGKGKASIETPRGAAHLSLKVAAGAIQEISLDVPSFHHMALLEAVAAGQELGDALLSIHSLDLSPWEIDQ